MQKLSAKKSRLLTAIKVKNVLAELEKEVANQPLNSVGAVVGSCLDDEVPKEPTSQPQAVDSVWDGPVNTCTSRAYANIGNQASNVEQAKYLLDIYKEDMRDLLVKHAATQALIDEQQKIVQREIAILSAYL